VQTDNGSEFGGAWNRRRTPPAFTRLVEQKYRCRQHRFNPPHRSTYNSDVEAVHGLMEQEFYHLEPFRGDLQRFLNQAWTYQLWFNYLRENSAKGIALLTSCAPSAPLGSIPRSMPCRLCYCHLSQPKICPPPGRSWVRIYLGMSRIGSSKRFPKPCRQRADWAGKRWGYLHQPERPLKTRSCAGREHETVRGTSGRRREERLPPPPRSDGSRRSNRSGWASDSYAVSAGVQARQRPTQALGQGAQAGRSVRTTMAEHPPNS
jgi:hypothetical protein